MQDEHPKPARTAAENASIYPHLDTREQVIVAAECKTVREPIEQADQGEQAETMRSGRKPRTGYVSRYGMLRNENGELKKKRIASTPVPTEKTGVDEEAAAIVPMTATAVEKFCDEYMLRLTGTTIKVRANRPRQGREFDNDCRGSCKAVLSALCSLMLDQESEIVEATEERLARRANVAPNTASNALERLEEAGYLIRYLPEAYGMPSHYALAKERLAKLDRSAPNGPRSLADVTQIDALITGDLSHDAFRAKNAGKNGMRVYEYLLLNPDQTQAEIARGMSMPKPTVKANLVKLQDQHFVAQDDNRRWRVCGRSVNDDLDIGVEAARKLRSNKWLARQRSRREEALRIQAEEAIAIGVAIAVGGNKIPHDFKEVATPIS